VKLLAILALGLLMSACNPALQRFEPAPKSKPAVVVICEDVTPPESTHPTWRLAITDADHAWLWTHNYGSIIPPFTDTLGHHFVGQNLALAVDDRCHGDPAYG
jgi:hypothetical protein